MAKIWDFIKKIPVKVLLGIVIVVFAIIWIVSLFLPGKKNVAVQKKLDEVLDKIDNKKDDLVVEKVKIDTEKKTQLQTVEEKRKQFNAELEEINKISDKRRKAEELLKLHTKIRKERENK